MPNVLDPEIARLNGAVGKKALAEVILQASDYSILKFGDLYEAAVRRMDFTEGVEFLTIRRALLTARRNMAGGLPRGLASQAEDYRQALSRFVAEPEVL